MKSSRYSKQRELIYEALAGSREHPSAEMIYHSLKATVPSLSLGTVYRNLNHLVEEGRAIRLPCAVNRYDATLWEHPHFYCSCCGKLYDLDLSFGQSLNEAVEDLGHQVSRHELIFYGICSSCQNSDKHGDDDI